MRFNTKSIVFLLYAVVVGATAHGTGNVHHQRDSHVAIRDAASAAAQIQGAIYQIIAALASGITGAAGLIPKQQGQVPWNWGTQKAIGVCLGNWLTLERFMDEDWFTGLAGTGAQDEWTFTANLGSTAAIAALQQHYAEFITEADFDMMLSHGINHVRIPTGFWTWIPVVNGESYVNAGQLGWLQKAVGWAAARGMYVLVDLHGLPGSQNGEESSGHLAPQNWFGTSNTPNQVRSDQTLAAVLSWISSNPYKNTISGIEPINEPRPYGDLQNQQLADYYARSYRAIQASAHPVTMFIHPGFIADAFTYWRPFVQARLTNPPSIVIEDHPYPGNFPPQYDSSDILNQVCNDANRYLSYPVPVSITEMSIYTGIKTSSFEQQFYESQVSTWSWSAGSFYWSLRVIPSRAQLAAGLDYSQYSWAYLVARGVVPSGNSIGVTNANAYIASFSGDANCGSAPYNASPYP